MSAFNFRSVAVTATSAIVAMSLVACEGSKLALNTRKDGSIEVVADTQVRDDEVVGGIDVGDKQGIAIDPSGIEDGSFHVQVVRIGDDTTGDDTVIPTPVPMESTDGEDDATGTTSSPSTSGETIAGKVDSASSSHGDDEAEQVTPQDGTTVFSRTLSAKDVTKDGDNILTVTSVDKGYYYVFVSAEYAKGKVVIRAYDLSAEEIADREVKGTYDKMKDIVKGLKESLSDNKATEVSEVADEEETDVADEATDDATSDAEDDSKVSTEGDSKDSTKAKDATADKQE